VRSDFRGFAKNRDEHSPTRLGVRHTHCIPNPTFLTVPPESPRLFARTNPWYSLRPESYTRLTSHFKKKIRYGYDGVRDAARRLTGWRVSVGAANANAHKAVAGYVVVVGEFGKK